MKSTLVFNPDSTSVHIVFANGKESISFENKEEALIAIADCFSKQKITEEEKQLFLKTILLSEQLPDYKKSNSLMPLIVMIAAMGLFDEEPLANPTVQLCSCGKGVPHAYFYDNDVIVGPPFLFKDECELFVEKLFEEERVTEGNRATLRTLITFLQIPESAIVN